MMSTIEKGTLKTVGKVDYTTLSSKVWRIDGQTEANLNNAPWLSSVGGRGGAVHKNNQECDG